MESKGGHHLIWEEAEIAALEHAGSEVRHDRSCLEVEVSEHFVGSPLPKEAYDVRVDFGTEESICARCAEAAGAHVGREKAKAGSEVCDSIAQGRGDVGWGDFLPSAIEPVSCERVSWVGVMSA